MICFHVFSEHSSIFTDTPLMLQQDSFRVEGYWHLTIIGWIDHVQTVILYVKWEGRSTSTRSIFGYSLDPRIKFVIDRFGNHQPWHIVWKACAGRYFRLSRTTPNMLVHFQSRFSHSAARFLWLYSRWTTQPFARVKSHRSSHFNDKTWLGKTSPAE